MALDQVHHADCRVFMRQIPDNTIHLVLTSPPYWGLRTYGEEAVSTWNERGPCEHEWVHKERIVESFAGSGSGWLIGHEPGCEDAKAISRTDHSEYWEKKDKGSAYCAKCGAWKGQLGLEPHPQMYIDHIRDVCREIKRILRPDGSFYLNMGDSYYGSGPKGEHDGKEVAFSPSHGRGKHDGWLQPKQKLLIPSRVAIALQDDGWILRSEIVWWKPNHMPSSVKDRLSCAWEPVFHFVKSGRYYYDLDAIREPHSSTSDLGRLRWKKPERLGGFATHGIGSRSSENPLGKNPGDVYQGKMAEQAEAFNSPRAREAREGYDAEAHFYHPEGKNPGDIFQSKKKPYLTNNPHIMRLKHDEYLALDPSKPSDLSHPLGKNPGDFWSINTKPFPDAHFAVFPEELCRKPILSSSPKGSGIVFDPFMGSGTVCIVARELGRHYLGCDVNLSYVEIARKRLGWELEKFAEEDVD